MALGPPEWSAATRDTEAPFHIAIGFTADETLRRLTGKMAALIEKQSRNTGSSRAIDPDRLLRAHRAIFGHLFPTQAGCFRCEDTHFGILVEDEDGTWRRRGLRGAPPHDIRARLADACQPFAAAKLATDDPRSGYSAAARLLVDIVRIHPFIDGNLRVGIVAMQAALCSHGLPVAYTTPFNREFMYALYYALRPDERQDPDMLVDVLHSEGGTSTLGRAA